MQLRNEGVRALFTGFVPAVMRAFPAHAVSEVTRWEGLGGDAVSGSGWEVTLLVGGAGR